MPDGDTTISVRIVDSIRAFQAEDWDACAGDDCPLISHAFPLGSGGLRIRRR